VTESSFENAPALALGMENLEKHIDSVRQFGLDPVVALNVRAGDTSSELDHVLQHLRDSGVHAGLADVFAQGGSGATALVESIVARAKAASPSPRYIYDLSDPPAEKIRKVARAIYGATDVDFTIAAKSQLDRAVKMGFGEIPICMAKTHLSLSHDGNLRNRPSGFTLPVRALVPSAGAGFVVALCGEMQRMPGLGKTPAFHNIDIDANGNTVGLF
jgi:formate--tetrahydrofolate ligase